MSCCVSSPTASRRETAECTDPVEVERRRLRVEALAPPPRDGVAKGLLLLRQGVARLVPPPARLVRAHLGLALPRALRVRRATGLRHSTERLQHDADGRLPPDRRTIGLGEPVRSRTQGLGQPLAGLRRVPSQPEVGVAQHGERLERAGGHPDTPVDQPAGDVVDGSVERREVLTEGAGVLLRLGGSAIRSLASPVSVPGGVVSPSLQHLDPLAHLEQGRPRPRLRPGLQRPDGVRDRLGVCLCSTLLPGDLSEAVSHTRQLGLDPPLLCRRRPEPGLCVEHGTCVLGDHGPGVAAVRLRERPRASAAGPPLDLLSDGLELVEGRAGAAHGLVVELRQGLEELLGQELAGSMSSPTWGWRSQ